MCVVVVVVVDVSFSAPAVVVIAVAIVACTVRLSTSLFSQVFFTVCCNHGWCETFQAMGLLVVRRRSAAFADDCNTPLVARRRRAVVRQCTIINC